MDAEGQHQKTLVQDLVRRILREGDDCLTERRLANDVGYSVTHIRRVFCAAMNESLGDFIRRIRLERAAGHLIVDNQSVAAVALAANYQSGEAFAKGFRARFQSPPTEFRALNQGCEHLLPGYFCSERALTEDLPKEVGLYVSCERIVTYLYDGISLVGRIDPDPVREERQYGSNESGHRVRSKP
jgi:AraC-like DNA-binding protein